MTAMYSVLFAALGFNVVVGLVYGYDKWQAKRGGWRVPERTLLGLAAAFGALGAWLAMRVFRHKTRKPRFRFGVPLLLALQLLAAAALGYHRFVSAAPILPASSLVS